MRIMISCPHNWRILSRNSWLKVHNAGNDFILCRNLFSPSKRFPLFMNLNKRCNLCNLLLDIPAHWFAHLHIMLGVANFVKMALRINNLCALWEISTWIALIMAFFLVQFSQLYPWKSEQQVEFTCDEEFFHHILYSVKACVAFLKRLRSRFKTNFDDNGKRKGI